MSNCLLLNIEKCHINPQTIQPQKLFCICCLENNVQFIALKNCDHSNFLSKFSIPDNCKQYFQVVCILCHTMLKKIMEFELQIEESFKVLSAQTHTQKPNLRRTKLNIEKKEHIQIYDNYERIQNGPEHSTEQLANENGSYQNTPNSVKLKNLQNALDVISSNNSLPLFELLSGINSLKKDVLGTVVSDSLSAKFGTPPSAGEYVNTQKNSDLPSNNVAKSKTHTNPIRKVKLTKKQLMKERYYQSWSKAYLKYPYKCDNCIQGFNYKENLEDHMTRKHESKLGHNCDICLQNHPAGTINTHKSRHYIRYLCVECSKTYPSRDEAVFHYQKRHAKRYKCGACGYLAEDLKRLCNHRVKRHRFSCKECGVVYATFKRLKWHEILKHKDLTKESL